LKQRSEEWFEARMGKLTASVIGHIMPGKRGGYLAARENLLIELQNQNFDIRREKTFGSAQLTAMEWGTKYEPDARRAYELATGDSIEEMGLVDHPTLEGLAASPDGKLILENKLIEIKCPYSDKHDALIQLNLEGVPKTDTRWVDQINSDYQWQMLCQAACVGATEVDFVQYDPRVEEAQQLMIIPFPIDSERMALMMEEAEKFINELNERVNKRRSMNG